MLKTASFLLVFLFLGSVSAADLDSKTLKPFESSMEMHGSKIIEVLLIDPSGKKTGFDSILGKTFKEDPKSTYEREYPVTEEDLKQEDRYPKIYHFGVTGLYKIIFYGLKKGDYNFEITSGMDGDVSRLSFSGRIERGERLQFQFEREKDGRIKKITTDSKK